MHAHLFGEIIIFCGPKGRRLHFKGVPARLLVVLVVPRQKKTQGVGNGDKRHTKTRSDKRRTQHGHASCLPRMVPSNPNLNLGLALLLVLSLCFLFVLCCVVLSCVMLSSLVWLGLGLWLGLGSVRFRGRAKIRVRIKVRVRVRVRKEKRTQDNISKTTQTWQQNAMQDIIYKITKDNTKQDNTGQHKATRQHKKTAQD